MREQKQDDSGWQLLGLLAGIGFAAGYPASVPVAAGAAGLYGVYRAGKVVLPGLAKGVGGAVKWVFKRKPKPPAPRRYQAPALPPPLTVEQILCEERKKYEKAMAILDTLPLDEAERRAAKEEAKARLLRKTDELLH